MDLWNIYSIVNGFKKNKPFYNWGCQPSSRIQEPNSSLGRYILSYLSTNLGRQGRRGAHLSYVVTHQKCT